jgi:hypothetical protein
VRVFYDTEFWENGRTIDLASIGMVTEAGHDSLYYVNGEFPFAEAAEANPWLAKNVYPHLPVSQIHGVWHVDFTDERVVPRDEIRHHVEQFLMYCHRLAAKKDRREFVAGEYDRDDIELWAFFSAYDHVALCQLWGRMIDLPPYVPMFTNDLASEARVVLGKADARKLSTLVPQTGEHDALADARWDLEAFQYLQHRADAAYQGAP